MALAQAGKPAVGANLLGAGARGWCSSNSIEHVTCTCKQAMRPDFRQHPLPRSAHSQQFDVPAHLQTRSLLQTTNINRC